MQNGTIWEIYRLCLQSENRRPALRGRRNAAPVGQTHEGAVSLYVSGLAASLIQLTKGRRSEKSQFVLGSSVFWSALAKKAMKTDQRRL